MRWGGVQLASVSKTKSRKKKTKKLEGRERGGKGKEKKLCEAGGESLAEEQV